MEGKRKGKPGLMTTAGHQAPSEGQTEGRLTIASDSLI